MIADTTYSGGALPEHDLSSSKLSVSSLQHTRVLRINTTAIRNLFLPPGNAGVPLGGPLWTILNTGAFDVKIWDAAAGGTLHTLAAGDYVHIFCRVNTTEDGTWWFAGGTHSTSHAFTNGTHSGTPEDREVTAEVPENPDCSVARFWLDACSGDANDDLYTNTAVGEYLRKTVALTGAEFVCYRVKEWDRVALSSPVAVTVTSVYKECSDCPTGPCLACDCPDTIDEISGYDVDLNPIPQGDGGPPLAHNTYYVTTVPAGGGRGGYPANPEWAGAFEGGTGDGSVENCAWNAYACDVLNNVQRFENFRYAHGPDMWRGGAANAADDQGSPLSNPETNNLYFFKASAGGDDLWHLRFFGVGGTIASPKGICFWHGTHGATAPNNLPEGRFVGVAPYDGGVELYRGIGGPLAYASDPEQMNYYFGCVRYDAF